MIAEFWELVVETWEQGIRGIGIDDILICLGIVLVSLIARSLMNSIVLDRVAKFTEKSETTLDDEIVDSLRGPFGLIPIAFGLYLITSYLPFSGSLDMLATNLVKMVVIYTIFSAIANLTKPLLNLLSDNSWLTPRHDYLAWKSCWSSDLDYWNHNDVRCLGH